MLRPDSTPPPPPCAFSPCEPPAAGAPVGRYLARQPILDVSGHVVAYELLFRSGPVNAFNGSGDAATRTMIDNATLFGMGTLTTGLPALLNCTTDTLLSQYIYMLPPSLTVLEVLEDVEPSEEVVKACLDLRRHGYKIALDDFQYRPSLDPLVRMSDFLKIDFRATSSAERREIRTNCREFKGAYLAEKVETREQFQQAMEEGFTLFQGYYFCEPLLLKKQAVPANRVVHLRLLTLMQKRPLDIHEVSQLVKSEPSLTYRLLRYVNSAGFGMRQKIDSIETALITVGDDVFRRMATLAVAVEFNAAPSPEVVRMALVRARFCETAGMLCNLNPGEQYLLGLLSLLDAMLQMPMEEALAPLSLVEPIQGALLHVDDRHRCPLHWLESRERGDFDRCDELAASHGFAPDLLEQNFSAATFWADTLLIQS